MTSAERFITSQATFSIVTDGIWGLSSGQFVLQFNRGEHHSVLSLICPGRLLEPLVSSLFDHWVFATGALDTSPAAWWNAGSSGVPGLVTCSEIVLPTSKTTDNLVSKSIDCAAADSPPFASGDQRPVRSQSLQPGREDYLCWSVFVAIQTAGLVSLVPQWPRQYLLELLERCP